MTRTRTISVAIFLALLGLLATSCGSDSSVSVSESDGSSESDSSSDPSSDDSSSDDTADPGSLEDSLDDANDSIDELEGLLGDEYSDCLAIASAYTQLGALMLGGSGEDVDGILSGIEGRIPDEIKDDFDVVSAAFAQVAEEGIFAGGEAMDTPEFEEANANIEAYVDAECADPTGG